MSRQSALSKPLFVHSLICSQPFLSSTTTCAVENRKMSSVAREVYHMWRAQEMSTRITTVPNGPLTGTTEQWQECRRRDAFFLPGWMEDKTFSWVLKDGRAWTDTWQQHEQKDTGQRKKKKGDKTAFSFHS